MILEEDDLVFEKIKPDKKERKNGFITFKLFGKSKDRYILMSKKVNSFLQNDGIQLIEIEPGGCKKVKAKIEQNQACLKQFFNYFRRRSQSQKAHFFNEAKLCLAADIVPNSESILCRKGFYFDGLLTNESFGKYLLSAQNSNEILADARSLFPVKKIKDGYVLKDISSSFLNNQIGVSCLAITSDNHLVFWRQHSKNMMNPGKFAPTGSGSCDYSDLMKNMDGSYSFPKTIKKAIERELAEETGLLNNLKIKNTKILGFFRWVKRGGKPEFVGLSQLDLPIKKLNPNLDEVFEKRAYYFKSTTELPKVIDGIFEENIPMSIPLHYNLLLLKSYFKNQNKTSFQ